MVFTSYFVRLLELTPFSDPFFAQAANELNSLTIPPNNRLEKLKGKRSEQHSIRINDKWRIYFIWKSDDAYNVEIIDYH